ncbi:MAG TPA: hypothetical protein VKP59_03775 [Candidatus Thermoplasmatota archaeon]|nr:hypothetical protein [Candidatus Thermoplasmatota archaeon]
MNDEDKKKFIDEFKKAEGEKKLDMWDFALSQQVLWEKIIAEIQDISHELGIDKKLEKMMEEELKKAEA